MLKLFVIGVPEFHDDPLDVEGIHSMCRNDFPVYLRVQHHVFYYTSIDLFFQHSKV